MKKDDFVKIIRAIVKQEIKKELPNALTQVFQSLMVKSPVKTQEKPEPNKQKEPENSEDNSDLNRNLKSQLKEILEHGEPVERIQKPVPQKKYTDNPVINEILNQTSPFNSDARMAMRANGGGGVAMSPAVAIAARGYSTTQNATTGVGEMMDGEDLSFLKKIPGMPGADAPFVSELPTNKQPAFESPIVGGQPSALDLKNHPALPDSIKGILNRDYRSLVRAMEKKK